jgi:hypothetical protein
MTPEQGKAILSILGLANEKGKFAIAVGLALDETRQTVLERGMDEDWFRLIDVTPLTVAPTYCNRVFKLTPTGEMIRNQAREAAKELLYGSGKA